ncbi:transglutaminase domain-containing protein [Agarivorans sp.]|uniref:transglutaminase domain-containing protein n=1 Tax=Agarivorans sp. TaxID=1872412 RepID=UPI003D04B7DC
MDIDFYKKQSAISDVSEFSEVIRLLPNDVRELCKFVQGNLIHSYWISHYGCEVQDHIRYSEMQIRYAKDLLDKSKSKSKRPITEDSQPINKVVSICRDFSLLLCAILREKGIAARIRCGFSKYLNPGRYEDHWICEYWSESQERWIMVDAQLDGIHRSVLNYQFDECDVPNTEFIYAGNAWQLCRNNEAAPENFGIFDLDGFPFIKGNLVRDLFALCKVELMAWDTGWGILNDPRQLVMSESEYQLLDQLAVFSSKSDYAKAQRAIQSMDELKFPKGWDITQAPTISELLSTQAEL